MGERLDSGRDAQRGHAGAGPAKVPSPAPLGGTSGASARGQSAELNAATSGGAEVNAATPPGQPPGVPPAEGGPDLTALNALAAKAQAMGLPLVAEMDPATGQPTWRLERDKGARWTLENFASRIGEILASGAEFAEPAQLDAVVNRYMAWVGENYPIYPEAYLAQNPTAKAYHRADGDPRPEFRAMAEAGKSREGADKLGTAMGWFMVVVSVGNLSGMLASGVRGLDLLFDAADVALGVGTNVASKYTENTLVQYRPGNLGPFQLAWFMNYAVGHQHTIDRFFSEACAGVSEGMQAATRQTILALVRQKAGG